MYRSQVPSLRMSYYLLYKIDRIRFKHYASQKVPSHLIFSCNSAHKFYSIIIIRYSEISTYRVQESQMDTLFPALHLVHNNSC